jgi:4,5-DOPA dioxygenase extradiol
MSVRPSLFISHGAPTLLLDDSPANAFLRGLGARLGRPRAVLCVSAHWETARPAVNAGGRPDTIHDFMGFPRALHEFVYPAPGDPELAARVAALLAAAGMAVDRDPVHGLDHGAWVPLALMYPGADVPVVQLSVQPALGAAHHVALGRALAPLCAEDVLVLGSGSLTHNLAEVRRYLHDRGAAPAGMPWAAEFEGWIADAVAAGDLAALVDYRARAPHAEHAHPTDEHLLPLHVAAAAGGGAGRPVHRSLAFGSLSMAAYAFPGLPEHVDPAAARAVPA